MCGICGLSWPAPRVIKKMNDAIAHRGPDAHDVFFDDKVSLGHRRLAIIDLSPLGEQPMRYTHKRRQAWMVFNGEIYNFAEIQAELKTKGYRFKSASDSEVILAAYLEWGERCVERFNGMWALAIYDVERERLFCSRDRLGIKPFYYALQDGKLAFGSELRCLRSAFGTPKPDPASISDLFEHRAILGEKTFWTGFKKLLPGHNLTFDLRKKSLSTKQYWTIPSLPPITKQEAVTQLRELLEDAVKKRLLSDVPVCVSLSGGLDSAIVTAIAKKFKPDITAFTVGYGVAGDEVDEAKETAKALGVQHEVLMLDPKRIAVDLDAIAAHLEEPAPDPAIVPSYGIYRAIREHATVVLLGEGSDELFGGYMEYKLHTLPVPSRGKAFRYLRRPFKKEFPTARAPLLPYKGDLNAYLRLDVSEILPNFQLLRVDKLSMAHALEARVPFLDYRIVELAFRIRASDKLTFKEGKHILREAARAWLPESVIKRKKKTFFSPLSAIEPAMLAEVAVFASEKRVASLDYAYLSRLPGLLGELKGRNRARKQYELFVWWLVEKASRNTSFIK